MTQSIIDLTHDHINQREKYKNAYFWQPGGNAGYRERLEKQNTLPKLDVITEQGDHIEAFFEMSCSRKNYYINQKIYKNDKKSNIRTLRNLLDYLNTGGNAQWTQQPQISHATR